MSKPAYEQVLKTLENISYSGDINADLIQNAEVVGDDVNAVNAEDAKGICSGYLLLVFVLFDLTKTKLIN